MIRLNPLALSAALLAASAALLVASPVMAAMAQAASLSGTASIRERIALPPDAVFEAVLIDIAHADAPERMLGRVRLQPAGQSPFRFTIPDQRQDITLVGRYTVRATIRQGELLLFTTDTINPVLTSPDPLPLKLQLVQVAAPTPAHTRLTGLFTYLADSANMRLCASGERLLVAMEGDYLRLERAYLRALRPGAAGRPLLVKVNGQIRLRPSAESGRPPQRSAVVTRFLQLSPLKSCP